jgi:catechol 2,3-dioxygenase-like lactoylglutathione lyase family enzyme
MRTAVVFVTGLLLGSVVSTLAQGNRLSGMNGVNHVGIYVSNFDESVAFYTQKMGFREAFTVRDDKGQPMLAYMQASRNTFVELQPANANRTPGISHFGLHVDDIKGTIAALRQRGVTVDDARASSAKSLIANVTAPDGVRIELSELGPESLATKATESWK